jgi:hypothetical protein
MKAMSINQPWVHAILHEGKDIENRSWQRSFRGWLAIHASAKPLLGNRFPRGGSPVPDLKTLDYSAICGVARVVDIVTKSRSKWLYCHCLSNIHKSCFLQSENVVFLTEMVCRVQRQKL